MNVREQPIGDFRVGTMSNFKLSQFECRFVMLLASVFNGTFNTFRKVREIWLDRVTRWEVKDMQKTRLN